MKKLIMLMLISVMSFASDSRSILTKNLFLQLKDGTSFSLDLSSGKPVLNNTNSFYKKYIGSEYKFSNIYFKRWFDEISYEAEPSMSILFKSNNSYKVVDIKWQERGKNDSERNKSFIYFFIRLSEKNKEDVYLTLDRVNSFAELNSGAKISLVTRKILRNKTDKEYVLNLADKWTAKNGFEISKIYSCKLNNINDTEHTYSCAGEAGGLITGGAPNYDTKFYCEIHVKSVPGASEILNEFCDKL